MFNIGFGELLVILLLAFIVVGPSDLPKVARQVAKAYKQLKNLVKDITAEINLEQELAEIKDLKKDMDKMIQQADPVNLAKKEVDDISKSIREAEKEAKKKFNE